MRTKINMKKAISIATLTVFTIGLIPFNLDSTNADSNIVYPLKKISKLECRFDEFDTLSSNCIEDLPILKTSDYKKYANNNGGYNKYTRIYTVLWGGSYKYGWDVGYGGHMGVDIATAKGTPVYAMSNGTVIAAGYKSSEGNYISIKHNINGKTIVSNYMHLSKIDVSVGQTVKTGEYIGKVGSTGNSTGNHLHFQIDTNTSYSSPAYYNYKSCPYSYYQITEEGVCFEELQQITVDPLLFLETNGAVFTSTTKVSTNTSSSTSSTSSSSSSTKTGNIPDSIFNTPVNVGASSGDIRTVQLIYKSLGYYNGELTGDYNDVYESVIKYQLDKGVISSRDDDGAGNFGPKTRAQTKSDWQTYIANGGKLATTVISTNTNNETTDKNEKEDSKFSLEEDPRVITQNEKIERENLQTREDIANKELEEFFAQYKIDLEFLNGGNIPLNGTETLTVKITNSKGRPFSGTTPGNITFVADKTKVEITPENLYYFTDGKRDIEIKGLKQGATTLYVKVGNKTIKTQELLIYNGTKNISPNGINIIGEKGNLGDTKTAVGVLTQGNKNLINIEYEGEYKLKANDGNLICLKKGDLGDIKKVFNSECSDFKSEITFNYKDTVGGIVIFDYKAKTTNISLEISKNGKNIASKSLNLSTANVAKTTTTNTVAKTEVKNEPKVETKTENTTTKTTSTKIDKIVYENLDNSYVYNAEVLASLESGISTTKSGIFMEKSAITELEGLTWVKNALENISTTNSSLKTKINSNLAAIKKELETADENEFLDRIDVLEMVTKYLIFDENTYVTIRYRDLNDAQNQLASSVFDKNTTWKEENGNKYFKPDSLISRGETAYLIMKGLENGNKNNISLK